MSPRDDGLSGTPVPTFFSVSDSRLRSLFRVNELARDIVKLRTKSLIWHSQLYAKLERAAFGCNNIKGGFFMPFINVKTNVSVTEDRAETIKTQFGKAITAIPGKSESWLMVGIEPNSMLWFRGTSEEAAMVEVSLFGGASHNAYSVLTSYITKIVSEQLGIPADRIYVKYSETANWGWNGSNF